METQTLAIPRQRTFKYYDLIMASFVTVLICSNIVGSAKACRFHFPIIGELNFTAGVLFFPISYIFGDILTEVYGYARARKVVWAGFVALIFASIMSWFVVVVPPAPGWPNQKAYEVCYGTTPRVVFASLIAFCIGEFANSYVLAKMKIWTKGKFLWSRIIGSTVVGELVDSAIFYPMAFAGLWPTDLVIRVMWTNYILKVLWEILIAPLTYKIVAFLKAAESEDYYDYDTDFTPFSLNT